MVAVMMVMIVVLVAMPIFSELARMPLKVRGEVSVPAFSLASVLLRAAVCLLFLVRVLSTYVLFPASAVIVHIRWPQHRVERDERRVQGWEERAHDVVYALCGERVCCVRGDWGCVVCSD